MGLPSRAVPLRALHMCVFRSYWESSYDLKSHPHHTLKSWHSLSIVCRALINIQAYKLRIDCRTGFETWAIVASKHNDIVVVQRSHASVLQVILNFGSIFTAAICCYLLWAIRNKQPKARDQQSWITRAKVGVSFNQLSFYQAHACPAKQPF